MGLLTVGQAAERLSRVEPYEDTPPSYFARQLRDFIQRGVVKPVAYRGAGRGSAAMLDAERLCIARLASVLTRLGLQSSQIEQAMCCLRNVTPTWFLKTPPEGHEGNSYTFGGLPSLVMREIKAGKLWYFRLWVEPTPKGTAGLGMLMGGFQAEEPGIGHPIKDAYPAIVINVTRLFGPLLEGTEDAPADHQSAGEPALANA